MSHDPWDFVCFESTTNESNDSTITERLKVPNGWLIRVTVRIHEDEFVKPFSTSLCFIPDKEHLFCTEEEKINVDKKISHYEEKLKNDSLTGTQSEIYSELLTMKYWN